MGPRARQVPLLVVQGDQDTTVPPVMADRLVQQWLTTADLVADGRLDDAGPVAPGGTARFAPGGDAHPYTCASYDRPGATGTLIEDHRVAGQGHARSGPRGSGLFVDRRGPDLAALTWGFAATRSQRD